MRSVTLPDTVTTVGTSAFENCIYLGYATIPPSVTSIGDDAFYGANDVLVLTETGSCAGQYAEEHAIDFEYTDEEVLGDGGEYITEAYDGFYELFSDYLVDIWSIESDRFDDAEVFEWIGEDEFISETGMDGCFTGFQDAGAFMWKPDCFQYVDLSEEDKEDGVIAAFATEDEDALIMAYYLDAEGLDLETFMDGLAGEENCSNVEAYVINDLPCVRYYLEDADSTVLAFLTEKGYLFQLFFIPGSSDEYSYLFELIENSIMLP